MESRADSPNIKDIDLELVHRGAVFTWDVSSSKMPLEGLFTGMFARMGKLEKTLWRRFSLEVKVSSSWLVFMLKQ